MPFTLWQQEDNPVYPGMANLCMAELRALADALTGTGVNRGLDLVYSSVATWTVNAGQAATSGLPINVAATTVTPANLPATFDRRDSVVVSPAGVVSVVQGTPCAVAGWLASHGSAGNPAPVLPPTPAGSVLIGEIYVSAGLTTLPASAYTDKRVTPALANYLGATMLEGIQLSAYGHSFLQANDPNSDGPLLGNASNPTVWSPFQNGPGRTAVARAAHRLRMIDGSTGMPGVRNAAMPGTTVQATAAQMIAGGLSAFNDEYGASLAFDLRNTREWNPGHPAQNAVGGSGLFGGGGAQPADKGIVLLQCALNDTSQWTAAALATAQIGAAPSGSGVTSAAGYYFTSARNNQNGSINNGSTTLTINPIKVTNAGATCTVGAAPTAYPYRSQQIAAYLEGTAGAVNLASTVSRGKAMGAANADTFVLADTPNDNSLGNVYTIPCKGDSFLIAPTVGTLLIPAVCNGGTLAIWYGTAVATLAITSSTTLANIAAAVQTLIQSTVLYASVTVTASGTLSSGTGTLTFSQSVGDIYFDFSGLTQTNNNGQPAVVYCTWVWTGTLYYATAAASWSGTALNSTLTITLGTAWAGSNQSNVPIVHFLGNWYGVGANGQAGNAPTQLASNAGTNPYNWGPNTSQTTLVGALQAWKNAVIAMCRWARCDTTTGASDRSWYSGIVKDVGGAIGVGKTGNTGQGVTGTIQLGDGTGSYQCFGTIAVGQQVLCTNDGGLWPAMNIVVAQSGTVNSGNGGTVGSSKITVAALAAGQTIYAGMTVTDSTNPTYLPPGTYVKSVAGSVVTLSNQWVTQCGAGDSLSFGGVVVIAATLSSGSVTTGTAIWQLQFNAPLQRGWNNKTIEFWPPGTSIRMQVPCFTGSPSTVNGVSFTNKCLYLLTTQAGANGAMPPIGANAGFGNGFIGTTWAGSGVTFTTTGTVGAGVSIPVSTTDRLVVGQYLFNESHAGNIAAGTTITAIVDGTHIKASAQVIVTLGGTDILQASSLYTPDQSAYTAQQLTVTDVQALANSCFGFISSGNVSTQLFSDVAVSFIEWAPAMDLQAGKPMGASSAALGPLHNLTGGGWSVTTNTDYSSPGYSNLRTTSPSSALQTASPTLTPAIQFSVNDVSNTGEVVVMYPAWAYDTTKVLTHGASTNGTGVGWQATASAGGGITATFNRISGFPWSVGTTILGAPPTHTQNTVLLSGLALGATNTITVAKNSGDAMSNGSGNAVEVEAVFSTTPLPPWVLLATEPQPWLVPAGATPGGLCYGVPANMDLAYAYTQIANMPELAWYCTAMPSITTLDAAKDLNGGQYFGLHPNDHGVLKTAIHLADFKAKNIEMMFDGPVGLRPDGVQAQRPATYGTSGGVNYANSSAGLGSRIGYA